MRMAARSSMQRFCRAAWLGLAVLAGCLVGAAAEAQLDLGRGRDNQPIQITADSLDVEQDKQVATFRGNVDAVQGEMRLRADEVKVHYKPSAQRSTARPAASNQAANSGSISRIDALGKVFVSSPQETARGDRGEYNLDTGIITLTGKEVVLTQGQNVIKGNRAVMNLNTGRSTVEGRVQSLFVPEQKGPETQPPDRNGTEQNQGRPAAPNAPQAKPDAKPAQKKPAP